MGRQVGPTRRLVSANWQADLTVVTNSRRGQPVISTCQPTAKTMEMSVTGSTDKWRVSSIWRLQHYTGRPDSPLGRADMTAHHCHLSAHCKDNGDVGDGWHWQVTGVVDLTASALHGPTWQPIGSGWHDGPSGRPVIATCQPTAKTMEMLVMGCTDKWRVSSIWRLQHYTGRPDSPLGRADMTAHRVGSCSVAFSGLTSLVFCAVQTIMDWLVTDLCLLCL